MKADIISYIRNGIDEASVNLTLINKELSEIKTRFPLEKMTEMKIEDWATVGDDYAFNVLIESYTGLFVASAGNDAIK